MCEPARVRNHGLRMPGSKTSRRGPDIPIKANSSRESCCPLASSARSDLFVNTQS